MVTLKISKRQCSLLKDLLKSLVTDIESYRSLIDDSIDDSDVVAVFTGSVCLTKSDHRNFINLLNSLS